MAGTAIRTALGVMLVVGFIGWILALIGIAGLQRNCFSMQTLGQTVQGPSTNGGSILASDLAVTGIRGINGNLACEELYRYYWWQLAWEVITLIALACMAAFGLLAASAVAWMAWLCVLAVLYIQGADTFLAIAGFSYNLGGNNLAYARLTAAGWIICAITNLGLIFLLGWRPKKLRSGAGGPVKY